MADKYVPEMIDLFVSPLCTVLITGFLTLGIIGPVFSIAESYVLTFAEWLISVGYGVGAMLMGALYPLTVVCGIHHMYNVIEAGMLSAVDGLNTWMPVASAANFAQGAACLAVGLKAKNVKTKAVAIPSSLSAALGITEPAIFGVNLRFVKPLVCGMAGGAAGALLGAFFHIGATSYGVTGIPGFLITLDYTLQYAVILVVSFVIAFALTWVFWKEEDEGETPKKEESKPEERTEAEESKETAVSAQIEKVLYAPITGKIIARDDIPDAVFASGALGDGVGIEPEYGEVTAPCDGEIVTVTETKHAVGIMGPTGMELLIHVGIDTVKMNGDGFDVKVSVGDKVKKGQNLLTFDIEKIKAAGYCTTTAVLVTNSGDYPNYRIVKTGAVEAGEEIISAE